MRHEDVLGVERDDLEDSGENKENEHDHQEDALDVNKHGDGDQNVDHSYGNLGHVSEPDVAPTRVPTGSWSLR